MTIIGEELITRFPDRAQIYTFTAAAANNFGGPRTAIKVLRIGVHAMPENADLVYTFACFLCREGDRPAAQEQLQRAFELIPTLWLKALVDLDFEPLWESTAGSA